MTTAGRRTALTRLWRHQFLEARPSIGLSFFRIAVALTTGLHVIPSFFCLPDNYFSTAFKTFNFAFFPPEAIGLVQKSPDALVVVFVGLFLVSWFLFLAGCFTQLSCLVMTACCYYFYALNSFPIGTLSWDILLVTLALMCLTPYPGDYFSIDALRSKDAHPFRKRRPFFVQELLRLQIALTYFYAGLYKITGPGNWWTSNPIYYLMNDPPEGVMKYFILKDILAAHPQFCYVVGAVIPVLEMVMPALLYGRKTRVPAIYLGCVFHVVLILTMDVPAIFFFLFPAQLLLFIPPEDVVRWIDRRREFNRRGGQSVVVYDGHCRFCQGSVRLLSVMDLFGALKFIDYQQIPDPALLHPQLTRRIAHSQLHVIEQGHVLSGGFFAFRRLCGKLPMLYPLIPVVYFPGVGLIGPVVYRWVSENRYLFHSRKPCRDNACFSSK